MKKITLILLSLWAVLFVAQPAYAGFISSPKQTESGKPSQKSHPKLDKMVEKVEKGVQALSEKGGFFGKILKNHGDIKNKWLVPAIVCLVISVVFGLGNGFLGTFYWLSYLAYLAFVVFAILWLLTLLDVM